MTIIPNLPFYNAKSPVHQLVVSLFVVLVIGTILFILFILPGTLIFNGSNSVSDFSSPETGATGPGFLIFTIIAQDISYFIIPAIIILTKFNPGYQTGIMSIRNLRLSDVLLVTILAFCTFPVTSLAGQLNSGMVLPDWLSGVEEWMKDKEEYADHLLDQLMAPETFPGIWLNIVIIAALPAISEELIFRGVFQKIFQNLFRSGNFPVWFTAFLFSAIHLQFYGFLPRFILGLIFGYLFLWSRNLWLPIIAHFINNAVPAAGAYTKGWEAINSPLNESPEGQISGTIIALVIGIMILAWIRRESIEVKD